MNFFEFFNKWNGKQVDVDGAYGAQCVDLMRKYCEEVLGVGLYALPRVDGAGDLYDKVGNNVKFNRFKNWPWAVPQQGDIILWKRSTSLPFGHVAIVNTASLMKFTSFDQNWGNDKKCRLVEHNYFSGCQGWLRRR